MSKPPLRVLYLLPLLTLLLCVNTAHACDCAEAGPPCQAFWRTDAVFVATVMSKSPTTAGNEHATAVRLSSQQVFKGDIGGGEVEVVTGVNSGDCGYPFQVGRQYLVYATRWEKDQRLYTGICSRTRLLSDADEDLAYFRNLPRENGGGKILINVTKLSLPIDKDNGPFDLAPMAGLRVTAERDNKRLEGRTDENGNYEFTGVSPGNYAIRVYFSDDPDDYLSDAADVTDRGCSSVPILYQIGGEIQGKVVDANGQPANGVKVDLIRLEDATSDSPKGKVRFTNAEGHYKLPDVPPGKYVLGINLIASANPHCPRERTYYVNPNNSLQAGYVEMKERGELKDYNIQLPRGGVEREIAGDIVWPDGKPAVRGVAKLTTENAPVYLIEQKAADARGHFVLKGIEGCTYQVSAFTYGGTIAAGSNVSEEQRHAEPVTITLTEKKPPPIKLTLTSPGFMHTDDEQRRPKN